MPSLNTKLRICLVVPGLSLHLLLRSRRVRSLIFSTGEKWLGPIGCSVWCAARTCGFLDAVLLLLLQPARPQGRRFGVTSQHGNLPLQLLILLFQAGYLGVLQATVTRFSP